MDSKRNISIVGGAGHVGFPLGLILSSKGFKVSLIDKHLKNMKKINNGEPPFLEEKSVNLLKTMIKKKRILTTEHLSEVKNSKYIIICIGTPVNKRLNPSSEGINEIIPEISNGLFFLTSFSSLFIKWLPNYLR